MTNDNKIWCNNCRIWVARTDLKMTTNDAEVIEYWCSGCDFEFVGLRETTEEFLKRVNDG